MAVGDIALFQSIQDRIFVKNSIFNNVQSFFYESDCSFANFEFPFTAEKRPFFTYSYTKLAVNPIVKEVLGTINLHVCSLANNHVMDWGEEGLLTTKSILSQYGIQTVGAGLSNREARNPVIIERQVIELGFLAYAKKGDYTATDSRGGAAQLDVKAIEDDIRALKEKVDHVVISLHWGIEFSDYPLPEDIKLARQLIDAGASLVLGHHPHVLQGYEKYKDGMIFYSLGNFVYDPLSERVPSQTALDTRYEACIAKIIFSKYNIVASKIIPVRIDKHELRPHVLVGEEAEALLKRIDNISQRLGKFSGLRFYEHAIGNLVERELRTYWLLWREHRWGFLWPRLKGLKIRHLKLVGAFIMVKILAFLSKKLGIRQ